MALQHAAVALVWGSFCGAFDSLRVCCAQVFACTVGQKPSKAPLYVNDTAEVASILARLAQASSPAAQA